MNFLGALGLLKEHAFFLLRQLVHAVKRLDLRTWQVVPALEQRSHGCQGHSSLDSPSELNPPQRIPSPLFVALLVPQAEG